MKRRFGIWTATRMRFSHSVNEAGLAVPANLITINPDFETGDATGWTLTENAEVTASTISGVYSLGIFAGFLGTAASDKYPCVGESLRCAFLAYSAISDEVTVSVSIRFYDSTPTLLSTETIKAWSVERIALAEYSNDIAIPANATQFDIYVNKTTAIKTAYFDDFTVYAI